MESGKLNRRIQIQVQSTTQDSFGQPLQTWSTIYSCWASIDIQASQLIYSTAEFLSKVTYRITLRWTSSVVIAANQRVLYIEPMTGVTHTFEIQSVLNDETANRQITLLCYELNGKE